MVTVHLAQDLDHIGICIGAAKGISRAIKAQDELLWLCRVCRLSVGHREYQKKDKGGKCKETTEPVSGGPEQLSLWGKRPNPLSSITVSSQAPITSAKVQSMSSLADRRLHRELRQCQPSVAPACNDDAEATKYT